MTKFGMNVEVRKALLSLHEHIEQKVVDSRHLSLDVEQGCLKFYGKWPQHLLRVGWVDELVKIALRR